MNLPSTAVSPRITSRPCTADPGRRHVLGLAGSGALLAGLHEAFDLSLGMPGHFGVVFMAVLVFARAGSPLAGAAVLTTAGYLAGGMAFAGLGLREVVNLPGYLLCALALDALWCLSPALIRRPARAALAGAFAFTLKPLLLAGLGVVLAFDIGVMRHGIAFPVLTHAVFGAAGALIGALLWHGARAR